MSQPQIITSAANPRVKALARLCQHADERRATGRFIIETLRELQRAIAAGFVLCELYACPERLGDDQTTLEELSDKCSVSPIAITANVLEKIAYRQNPQGFIAVLTARSATLEQLLKLPGAGTGGAELIVVLSGLEKPGNVGAIARTADAAGATAMFIDCPSFDLYNPNVIRASTGAIFGLPVVCDSPEHLRDWLKTRQIVTIALTPEAQLTHLHLSLRGPVALIVGAEDRGLDDFWKSHADLACAIPMRSSTADSLNVSVSAAIMLFDAMRQRVN